MKYEDEAKANHFFVLLQAQEELRIWERLFNLFKDRLSWRNQVVIIDKDERQDNE